MFAITQTKGKIHINIFVCFEKMSEKKGWQDYFFVSENVSVGKTLFRNYRLMPNEMI